MSLVMIIPTKGRPHAVRPMGNSWEATRAHDEATLLWVVDADDPELAGYKEAIAEFEWMQVASIPSWLPLVPKLNWAARQCATRFDKVGFMGDDHLPRSEGWAARLHQEIDSMPACTGIVYGRDGFQDEALPTWWAMSSNIVTALGRMVPADVQHLYCDNAIYQLGAKSGTLRYVKDVLIEHMHPVAAKAAWDPGHIRVNRPEQYLRDRLGFEAWILGGADQDARLIADLRGV